MRAVRGGFSNNNFIDNGDGTISDTSTGLMWQKSTAPGAYLWEQALNYCESLTLAGHSDWRLPTWKELQSIVDYSSYTPTINTTFFPDTVASQYASSTTRADNLSHAWYVDFTIGFVNSYTKWKAYLFVRAVRGGQDGATTSSSSTTTSVIVDTDNDGIPDNQDNCPSVANPDQLESDADGIGDACDNCPNDPQNDIDADGICGDIDNCPNKPNGPNLGTCSASSDSPGTTCTTDADCVVGCSSNGLCDKSQADTDGDGIGDACDNCPNDPQNDIDGDGICGNVDNCPNEANADQADDNGDSIGNACDYKYWKTRFEESQNGQNAFVPQTGQTISYASGDDGALQKGVISPTPKFTDNFNGTVTDNLTNLLWTANANLPNRWMTWQEALDYVANMNAGILENFGYIDWRLPNIRELQSLLDYGNSNLALPNRHPFIDVVWWNYWTSTTYAGHTESAWYIGLDTGAVNNAGLKTGTNYVWPVRGPVSTTTTSVPPDTDSDGYPDNIDNCPSNCNMQQLDADGDGIGDVCDSTPGCGGSEQPACEVECIKYTI